MKNIFIIALALSLFLCGCGATNETAVESSSMVEASSLPETSSKTETANTDYSEILASYKKLVEFRLSSDFEEYWNNNADLPDSVGILRELLEYSNGYGGMTVELLGFPYAESISDFGYKLVDINSDGAEELFLVRRNGTILAILTMVEGKIQLVDTFWSKYKCVITDDFKIHTMTSGGSVYNYFGIAALVNGELSYSLSFGIDGYDEENQNPLYYKGENNKQVWITEEEFNAISNQYPFKHGSDWNSIPITFLK